MRRILCPHCGEEDERKLGYFHAADPWSEALFKTTRPRYISAAVA
jgi:hypothetical protein